MLLVFVIGLSAVLITACETCPDPAEFTLPADLPVPQLANTDDPIDIERDFVTLVAQDLRWRIRMATARLIVGEISQEEYESVVDSLMERLEGVEE